MVNEDFFGLRKHYETPAILIKHISFADIIVTSNAFENGTNDAVTSSVDNTTSQGNDFSGAIFPPTSSTP